ncbi:Las1-domain-containing protein [Nadsonia fulvescens var. elongata DSM 6958]|uniref:Las1-domain-containing protein n=1 Tax=Nadsonia fulvescens var. elongata DSM 6958 TaxID=857566 RepID=A0A1E3PHG5_9ASCO|nr:Las1-domain-containing protein [Nadsonia fulvescens var. elongata DSM 6958]
MSSARVPKVVPWRSEGELDTLKRWFFPDETIAEDTRPRAVARTKAYLTRGSLPHAIESTSLLTAAILGDTSTNDSFSVRLTYSMAVIRFVNGLLDPAQRAQFAIPLHLLARKLRLPSFFVELRHAGTHEALPSIEILRDAAKRGLDWLWDNYWAVNSYDDYENNTNGSNNLNQADGQTVEQRKESLKEFMRLWRRMRREDPKRVVKAGDSTPEGKELWKLVKQIQTSLEIDEASFMDVLLYMNVLIPAGKDGLARTKASVTMFGPLLVILNEGNPEFIQRLFDYIIDTLNSQETYLDWVPPSLRDKVKNVDDPESSSTSVNFEAKIKNSAKFNDAIMIWLKFFLASQSKKLPSLVNAEHAIKKCLALPRSWNVQVIQYCLDNSLITQESIPPTEKLLESMRSASEVEASLASLLQSKKADTSKKTLKQVQNEVNGYCARLNFQVLGHNDQDLAAGSQATKKQKTGPEIWKRSENWVPKPIGVL